MTYFRFHWLFNFPVLGLLTWFNMGYPWATGELAALGWILLAVMVFTSPWDNDAVRRGIWGFPEGRYAFRIRWLPVEEYLFFVLQTVNVILLTRAAIHGCSFWRTGTETILSVTGLAFGGLGLLAWIGTGFWIYRSRLAPRWNYAVHLLFWFVPVILLQWSAGWNVFLAQAALLAFVTFACGTYYVISDLVAVHHGVWFFDEKQIQGWKLGKILPWEEIAFFYLTSLLVTQSYLLLVPAAMR